MGPFTAIAGGLSPVLRKLPKLDASRGRVGADSSDALLRSCRRRRGFCLSRLAFMSRALRHGATLFFHSVGSGRTSPPVRRRDPFPACRSTRGVVDGSRTFGNRVPHGSWSSSVGPATVLPLSAGDGGTMRDPKHVASRFFLVSFSCETLQSPHRLGRARGLARELGTGAAASIRTSLAPLRSGSRQAFGCSSALLLGAALLCRPPLRVSDVHRQPTRPVLKHGPRSPGRSRVVGAHLRTPEA